MKLILRGSVAALALAATTASLAAKPELGDFGFDASGMQRDVKPGDDFYKFANGGWDQRTEIPADQARWGAFLALIDRSNTQVRDVLEHGAAIGSADARKAGLFYTSFMDEAAIEKRGAEPLKAPLAKVAAIASPADLATAFGEANRDGVKNPFGLGVEADLKDNGVYALYLGQSGLGLPDRDYYLVDNPKFVEARTAYQAEIAKLFELAGIADGAAKAKAILALETEMARVQWSRVESRQMEKMYNPAAPAELAQRFPGLDWPRFLAAARATAAGKIIVAQPSAMAGMAKLVQAQPLAVWKDYLAYQTIAAHVGELPAAFVDADFQLTKALTGVPEMQPRWKRGVRLVNGGAYGTSGGMGEAVGQLYTAKYFPPAAKAKADELVRNIVAAMRIRLQKLTWMAPETKTKALAKLDAFTPKIGYPVRWKDYSALDIRADDAFGNALRGDRFSYDFDMRRVGKPIDRDEWGMTPQTVNAYANPPRNEIVFPAAILQPPFFDPNAEDAVNYGAIGAVIGHEISHHFDDQGRKFDPTGKLADWWTQQDVDRFKAYTDKVVAQYGAYEPLPGRHINGELTLGENMADLAGVNVAHDAWLISLKGKKAPVIDGFTGEQRFFLGFAQVWRNKAREAFLQQQLTVDPHTPGNWRVYVVRNLDSWYDAFGVQPGTKYYLAPADRLKVW